MLPLIAALIAKLGAGALASGAAGGAAAGGAAAGAGAGGAALAGGGAATAAPAAAEGGGALSSMMGGKNFLSQGMSLNKPETPAAAPGKSAQFQQEPVIPFKPDTSIRGLSGGGPQAMPDDPAAGWGFLRNYLGR